MRIVAPGTDLTLSLAGRDADVDGGRTNMPGGEFFYAPMEDSAEGVMEFGEFPSVSEGLEMSGVRLAFEGGRVVDASAASGEEYLFSNLDTDEGARRIGELGIGCNPGITRPMRNTLFDEKMAGTVHLALGESYTHIGGQNKSSLHWDLVKDLRERRRALGRRRGRAARRRVAAVSDPRVAEYARLLVERCLDAQHGWQVLVKTSPLARPLLEEVVRGLGKPRRLPARPAELGGGELALRLRVGRGGAGGDRRRSAGPRGAGRRGDRRLDQHRCSRERLRGLELYPSGAERSRRRTARCSSGGYGWRSRGSRAATPPPRSPRRPG